jgi:hypothetical protein
MKKYLTPDSRLFEIMDDTGLGGGFCVIWRGPAGGVYRTHWKDLPPRETREEAQKQLDEVAKNRKWSMGE